MTDGAIKLYGKHSETELLKETAQVGRLPHGIMLTGEKGIGKRTFAKWCAMLYLCTSPASDGSPCGKCRSCKNIIAGEHADVMYVKDGKYKKETIKKSIRDASFLPNDSDTRIIIYEDCEEMTEEQQNVLIKAIEEPSAHNRYIFTCSNPSAVIETIKSRLVAIRMSDMTGEECAACLEEQGISASDAVSAVERYGVNPGKILEILADESRKKLYDTADRLINAISDRDEYAAAVALTDCGTREELADIVSVLYERATEALTAAEKGSAPVRSPELSKLSKTKLYRLCEVLNSFLLLDGANINVKLTQAQLSARIFEAVE